MLGSTILDTTEASRNILILDTLKIYLITVYLGTK